MKARWLKSVVDQSKEADLVLPYHRDRRQERRNERLFALLRELKSA